MGSALLMSSLLGFDVPAWVKPLWLVGGGMLAALVALLVLVAPCNCPLPCPRWRPSPGPRPRRPLAAAVLLAPGCRASSCCCFPLHSLQHLRRRRQGARRRRADADHAVGASCWPSGRPAFRSPRRSKAARRSRCFPSPSAAGSSSSASSWESSARWRSCSSCSARCSWPASRTRCAYDARETSHPDPTWHDCALEMEKTAPGLALGLHGDGGAGVDQRGHFHAVADAAEPDHLRGDLRLGARGADVG